MVLFVILLLLIIIGVAANQKRNQTQNTTQAKTQKRTTVTDDTKIDAAAGYRAAFDAAARPDESKRIAGNGLGLAICNQINKNAPVLEHRSVK